MFLRNVNNLLSTTKFVIFNNVPYCKTICLNIKLIGLPNSISVIELQYF